MKAQSLSSMRIPVLLLLITVLILVPGCVTGVKPVIRGSRPSLLPTASPQPTSELRATVPGAHFTPSPTAPGPGDLSRGQAGILNSLRLVADYPLYTMLFIGEYDQMIPEAMQDTDLAAVEQTDQEPWGCSLFASLSNSRDLLYGRNFDWRYSPALLLFNQPEDGYASLSMVDLGYFVDDAIAGRLHELPLSERKMLLQAPYWPFDGMNEHGLAVGMAAVPASEMPYLPGAERIDSLMIIREVLDHARDVDGALALFRRYNLDWGGGPALHYLVADKSGNAQLVEFVDGRIVTIPARDGWHLATNFLLTGESQGSDGGCWRYEIIQDTLQGSARALKPSSAMALLERVSWGDTVNSTQWSLVYNMSSLDVMIAMGRDYDSIYTFNLFNLGE